MPGISRRLFLSNGVALGAPLAISPQPKNETVYHFATGDCDVHLGVEYYDRYSRDGFWFAERHTNRQFCFSSKGEEGADCLANFSGSLAVARYRVRPRSNRPNSIALSERVRTIDQGNLVTVRPPFERSIEFRGGVASDIQAFGYETEGLPPAGGPEAPPHAPWSLLRQDLYFHGQGKPFLILHWKHTLDAIRLLDLIPGDGTHLVMNKRDKKTQEEIR
jgi:hypothetical protein